MLSFSEKPISGADISTMVWIKKYLNIPWKGALFPFRDPGGPICRASVLGIIGKVLVVGVLVQGCPVWHEAALCQTQMGWFSIKTFFLSE